LTVSTATESSIITVKIFDQRKFKTKNMGFLGLINFHLGDSPTLQHGGDSNGVVLYNR
jgi:E3 ubiquitin-protein ligase NEDD4